MSTTQNTRRSITASETWVDGVRAYLTITAIDGFDIYTGTLPLPEDRKKKYTPDISEFDGVVQHLRLIPREHIYPKFEDGLTRFDPGSHGDDDVFFKAPSVSSYSDKSGDRIARTLLQEARLNEKIARNPHRNLCGYFGCVVYEGLVVRLAFPRYTRDLSHRVFSERPADLPLPRRREFMAQVASAAAHLHNLGLAHNDISPDNVMFCGGGGDKEEEAVLIDMDCCRPLGQSLDGAGGIVAGWRGPLVDNLWPRFDESSAECDRLAVQCILEWLEEDWEKKLGGQGNK